MTGKETVQMPKIGLVLSGGMLKGAYQVGALKNIRERFSVPAFRYISAASIGALNSYAFLMDRLDMAEQFRPSLGSDEACKELLYRPGDRCDIRAGKPAV